MEFEKVLRIVTAWPTCIPRRRHSHCFEFSNLQRNSVLRHKHLTSGDGTHTLLKCLGWQLLQKVWLGENVLQNRWRRSISFFRSFVSCLLGNHNLLHQGHAMFRIFRVRIEEWHIIGVGGNTDVSGRKLLESCTLCGTWHCVWYLFIYIFICLWQVYFWKYYAMRQ